MLIRYVSSAFMIAVLWSFLGCAAPTKLTVNGEPPLGAFGVDTLEHILACHKLGMNLVYTYQAEAGKKQLDLNDPMGKALAERKMKVMYILASRFTRVRLAKDLTPQDTAIPVMGEEPKSMEAFATSGTLTIEGERISYTGRTLEAFTGCQRSIEGTTPTRHNAGLLLCNSEALKQEILAIKDSPNLWGFWLVDDARPYEGDSLCEMSRVIRQYDRRPDGRPYNHAIVMGVGGISAMDNFDKGVCDALGIYLYPYHKGKLDMNCRRQMDYIVARAKALQPDIGIIGIPHAFRDDEENWREMPTPEQVREDILSYFNYGAAGVMPFIYHWQRPKEVPFGFDAFPAVCDTIAKTYAEIRSGKIKPAQPEVKKVAEWFRVLIGDEAKPSPGVACFDLGNAERAAVLAKAHVPGRIIAEVKEAAGWRYPVQVVIPRYDKNDPKGQRWPGVTFSANLLTTADWSKFRYLEQPVYNAQDHTVMLRAWLADSDGGSWARSCVPLPSRTPVLLRIPMDEVALTANPQKVRHWMLWFNEPAEDITLYLGNPTLIP